MKTCKANGCVNPVWGKGLCKFHQWMRTDKKPKKMPVQATRKHKNDLFFGYEDQSALFEDLWEGAKNKSGRVFCKYTREELTDFYGTSLWYSCFAHVLPKSRYTYWKLNPINIRIVFPDFHFCVDQGNSNDRKNHIEWRFDLWDAEVYKMKKEYEKFKKEHLLR